MIITVFYLFIILLEVLFALFACIYALSALYSSFMGSAYVPTRNKDLLGIFKEARLKKGQLFLDLGCGDGRVVREAVRFYQVKGIGIDINPVLIQIAKLKARIAGIKNIKFEVKNILQYNFGQADVIYIFLMPEFLKKLTPLIEKKAKSPTLIISHGFKFTNWQKKLVKTIHSKPFPTYFYRL